MAALTTNQVQAIETRDIQALTTYQLSAMSTLQAEAFTTTQVMAMTTNQIAAFQTAPYSHLNNSYVSPIILDLNGDGVRTLGIEAGVKFDLFADGTAINAGWVSSGDGLLVLDRNHDGSINDGLELFGTATKLSSGQTAQDGYSALRELDLNKDGVISSDDAAYAELKVWVDSNSDGVSQGGELKSLSSLGIAKISLATTVGTATDNGNILGLTSTYETTDGVTHDAADVWFLADTSRSGPQSSAVESLDGAIAALNPAATLAAGTPENTIGVNGGVVDAPLQVPGSGDQGVASGTPDLRTQVSGLAQAIGSFATADSSGDSASGQTLTGTGTLPPTSVGLAVVSMVDVMKQFDANGNPLGGAVNVAGTNSTTLTVPKLNDTASGGMLTGGGSA